MSIVPIRMLLDELAEQSPEAVERLCELRALWRSSKDARCEALARSYRGSHQELLNELRKQDLVLLLSEPTTIEAQDYYLPRAASYTKDELVRLALRTFCSAGVPRELELCDEAEEDDDGDLATEGDDLCGGAYQRKFFRDFEFSAEEAAKPLRRYQAKAVDVVLRELDPRQPKILQLATGGGKTRVANDIVVRWLEKHEGSVFWITKDWRLLLQAARDFKRRHRGYSQTRLGGDGHVLHPLPNGRHGSVVYTTLHTLVRRLAQGVLDNSLSLLVWDECHWGERGRAKRILSLCKELRIPVLGLTATPRVESRFDVAFCKTFSELVNEGFLARPLIEKPVQTGVRWRPQLRGPFDDVTQASLRELAENSERNRRIVDHYVAQVHRYGKTIVFACSIEHVNRLTDLFIKQGIAARPVHSHQTEEFNRRALDDFHQGAVDVLVNMEMLTHGIDVPDARTVFLCRPTMSDILFAQMVGRAARRDEATGKKSFFIVEFTDNIEEHGELFENAQRYFEGSTPGLDVSQVPGGTGRQAGARRSRHVFDLQGAPTWIPSGGDLPESLQGLWYRQGQSFGVEIELTTEGDVPRVGTAKWRRTAERLRERLEQALPGLVADQVIEGYVGSEGGKDCSVWNVEFDSSAGWEVTSRVLMGAEGFLEVDVACGVLAEAAAELGLLVDFRTGTHVHLGWLGENVQEVKRAIQLARLFEPALATLVAPSRIVRFDGDSYERGEPNQYCRPMASVFDAETLEDVQTLADVRRLVNVVGARYVTFNLKPLQHLHTVEVRMHSGTLEARKILLWVSLWQQILWAAAHRRELPDVADVNVLEPNGDIVALALKFLPDGKQPQQQALLQRLVARRTEMVEQWKAHPHLRSWVKFANRWMHVPR